MKKRRLFLMGLLCLYFYSSGVVLGQDKPNAPSAQTPSDTGKIYGVLTDSATASPISYATVALLQKGESQAKEVVLTDGAGKFLFADVPVGEYELVISFIGYKNKTIPRVAVTEGKKEVALGSIRLAPSVTALKEVQVEALRPLITQEADKLVVSVEGTALAAGRTAFDVLAKSPGVFVDQEGNIQLNGRSGVTVMLNGKLTYLSASDLRNLLEGMSAENIKNIEIITNPSAKYDAEGSSGILNINLKKNVQQGINGNVYAGYTYNFKQHAYTTGFSLNHMSGNWNTFVSLDQMKRAGNREGTFTRVFYDEDKVTYFDQVAEGKHKNLGPPVVRVGTDYSFNEKHSVGATVNYNNNTIWLDFLTDTFLGETPNQPDTYIEANNYTTNTYSNLTTNLHYVGKLDTLGSSLTADFDFVKIDNNGHSNFYNYYTDIQSGDPAVQDFLYTNTDNGFDIYAAKVDFTKALSKVTKLELGAKASRVVSDNDSRFFFNNSESLVLDPNRTNHFVYDENIYAAYANFSTKLGKRYSLQAGLRAEETQSEGKLLTTGQENNREYLNLFPSLFLQQEVNDNYQISYSYSRRIQRPYYGSLNPFIIYRDPYTYVQGNPGLRPQYTHAIGITQTFKKDYRLVLNYQFMQDVMSELPILDVENATTIYTTGNVDDSHGLSLVAMAPFKIMKNWDTNNTFTVSYNEFNILVNNQTEKNAQVLYVFQTTQNILLPFDVQMEVNSVVRGPGVSGLYKINPMWWMHLGFRKSFLDKKLQLSLNVNDIFRSYRLRFDTRIGRNINDFDQYFYNRNVGLTLRYNFSRGRKFDAKQRTNSLEELNRTGG